MPAQQGVRLDEEQRVPRGTQAAGQQHQQRPIRLGATGSLDLPLQDDQLLAQEGVLQQQVASTAGEIGG